MKTKSAQPRKARATSHQVKISRWGNSLALRIPAEAVRKLHIREGSLVSLATEEGKMTMEPETGELTLDELLEGVTPERVGGEIDWGRRVGNEAW